MSRYLVTGLCFFYLVTSGLNALSSEIRGIDLSAFPVVKFNLGFDGQADTSGIRILEDDRPVRFSCLQTVRLQEPAFCILIESSFMTHSAFSNHAIAFIVNGLENYLDHPGFNYDFAFGWYSRTDRNNITLRKLTDGFIPKGEVLTGPLRDLINKQEQEEPWTDLYKAVYECSAWMAENGKKGTSLRLIVIGTGKALSESPVREKECIDRAKSNKISIYTIGVKSNDRYAFDNMRMLSEKTNGEFTIANNAGEVEKALVNYTASRMAEGVTCTFEFHSQAAFDGKEHHIQVLTGHREYKMVFTAPLKNRKNASVLLVVSGIIVLLLVPGVFIFVRRRRTRKANDHSVINQDQTEIHARPGFQSGSFAEKARADEPEITGRHPEQAGFSGKASFAPEMKRHTQISVVPTMMLIKDGTQTSTVRIASGKTTLGRNRSNQVVVGNETVSGNHFVLEYDGFSCKLTNLSQTNGTVVNGSKVPQTIIYAGDNVKIGLVEILFK